jgi:NAD(P)-dependent dehydrogenase (short-subunit alcohol dehydrogenase family)
MLDLASRASPEVMVPDSVLRYVALPVAKVSRSIAFYTALGIPPLMPVGSANEAAQSAAKAGVIGFTRAVAREMARERIRLNCVRPGPIDAAMLNDIDGIDDRVREIVTKATPMRRIVAPLDIANVVAFLASDEAGSMTGQTVSVSGGLTMV